MAGESLSRGVTGAVGQLVLVSRRTGVEVRVHRLDSGVALIHYHQVLSSHTLYFHHNTATRSISAWLVGERVYPQALR